MTSTLKILVPLGLLVAVVFAVTYFSQVTPNEQTPDKGADTKRAAAPLKFFTNERYWDPNPFASVPNHAFVGFYEPGDTERRTSFWFVNRNPKSVTMKLLGVNCGSCSGGNVAAVPPAAARELFQMAAVSALPFGPVGACPPGMAGVGANLVHKLEWQSHKFDEPDKAVYTIPAGRTDDKWATQLGILELTFKVRKNGVNPLKAVFGTQVEGTEQAGKDEFSIGFVAAEPFELDKSVIDVGELTDSSPVQTHTVTVFSSTRAAEATESHARMPVPTVRVQMPTGMSGEPGPFVTAGEPVPVPPAELDRLMIDVSVRTGKPTRVLSAFRVPITVKTAEGNARADIGRLERDVWVSITGPGADVPKRLTVKGNVSGPVALAEGTEVNLGSFDYRKGVASPPVLVATDRPDIELAVVPGESRPEYMGVTLKKLPPAGDRGQYELRLTIPGDKHQGEIQDGVVVLEVKGPTPQRFRVPVKGRGRL